MERLPRRVHIAMMVTILFSVFALEPTPPSTAVPASPQRSSPLTEPLLQGTLPEPSLPPAPVVTAGDLQAVLEQKPSKQFELFDQGISPDSRRKLLAELPYGSTMARVSERHGLDGLLIAAIVEAESGFDPGAVSPRGAVGLMQLMPLTARVYGVTNLKDPRANLDAGSRYLRSLLEDYDGDLRLTLAAYNAGPAKVARYRGIPPYRETRAYVQRVLSRYRAHQDKAAAASIPEVPPQVAAFSLWQNGAPKSTDRLALFGLEPPARRGM